jgi:hypothetical protein
MRPAIYVESSLIATSYLMWLLCVCGIESAFDTVLILCHTLCLILKQWLFTVNAGQVPATRLLSTCRLPHPSQYQGNGESLFDVSGATNYLEETMKDDDATEVICCTHTAVSELLP